MMHDAVCMASGGLDSLVCMLLIKKSGLSALPIFVDYGQINKRLEFGALSDAASIHGFPAPIAVDVSGFGKVIRTGLTDPGKRVNEDAFTPNRNLLFVTIGSAVAFSRGINNVVLGLLSEQTAIFPDQTDSFLTLANSAISESLGHSTRIICPLRDYEKADVVRLAGELGIRRYYSCHSGTEVPCGKCIACLEYQSGGD